MIPVDRQNRRLRACPPSPGARTVHCVKFGKDMPGLERVPWKGDIGQARLRECVTGSLENVDRALEDADERVPAESARSSVAKNHGRANGAVFLRRRRQAPGGIRPTQSQGLGVLISQLQIKAPRLKPRYFPVAVPASGIVPVTGCSTGNRSTISNFRRLCARRSAASTSAGVIYPVRR
jgi:hypothetical protein